MLCKENLGVNGLTDEDTNVCAHTHTHTHTHRHTQTSESKESEYFIS